MFGSVARSVYLYTYPKLYVTEFTETIPIVQKSIWLTGANVTKVTGDDIHLEPDISICGWSQN